MTTLISTWVGVKGECSLWLTLAATLAQIHRGRDERRQGSCRKTRGEREGNENEHIGLIRAVQMKDERAVITVRFPLFQLHSDTPGNVFTLNKGVWWEGKSLSFPMRFTWRNTSCLFGFKGFGERKYAVCIVLYYKQSFFKTGEQILIISKMNLFQESSGHNFFFVHLSFSFHLLSRYWHLRKWLKQVEISIFPIYFRCLK